MDRLSDMELALAVQNLDAVWGKIGRVSITDSLLSSAAALAGTYFNTAG